MVQKIERHVDMMVREDGTPFNGSLDPQGEVVQGWVKILSQLPDVTIDGATFRWRVSNPGSGDNIVHLIETDSGEPRTLYLVGNQNRDQFEVDTENPPAEGQLITITRVEPGNFPEEVVIDSDVMESFRSGTHDDIAQAITSYVERVPPEGALPQK